MQTDLFDKIVKSNPKDAGPEGLALYGIALLLKKKGLLASDPYDDDIRAFHEKFFEKYDGPARCLPLNYAWRTKFAEEELKEFKQALQDDDLVKQFDALLDLMYIIRGTLYLMGLPVLQGWREVHASNMTKDVVAPGTGKFGTCVAKGFDYKKPKLNKILGLDWLEDYESRVYWQYHGTGL